MSHALKSSAAHIAVAVGATSLLALPALAAAAGLVPCDGVNCKFTDLVELGQKIINFLIFKVAAPLAAISFAVAGIMMLSAHGNEEQVRRARSIFWYVFVGFIIALSAWLIVKLIVNVLVNPQNFNPAPYISAVGALSWPVG